MGIFQGLRAGRMVADVEAAASGPTPVVVPQVESPWTPTPNQLESIVWADLFGTDYAPVSRAAAIALPPVARQRHLIAGTIARLPLRVIDGPADAELEDQPTWTSRTDGQLSPYHRMLWTVDDLIFYGWSLWRAHRGAAAQLLDADRIAYERWDTDAAGRLRVDGELVAARDVILIPGPHEGILNFGAATIRQAIANARAASNAAQNPSAYLELHYTGEKPLTDAEIDAMIVRWSAARRGENGGVAYTGRNVEVREHGSHEAQLLIEGRNADAVDLSRLVSSPAAMADATTAGASLTYETTEGRNGEFIDYGLALYMDAIAARLSMDDVVPRGQRAAFDTTLIRNLAPSPTGPRQED